MPQTILIVDDEQSIVVPLRFLMEQNGYKVITASSGEEAVDKISKPAQYEILIELNRFYQNQLQAYLQFL